MLVKTLQMEDSHMLDNILAYEESQLRYILLEKLGNAFDTRNHR